MYLNTAVYIVTLTFIIGSTFLIASDSSVQSDVQPISINSDGSNMNIDEYKNFLDKLDKRGGGRGFYRPQNIEERSGGRRFYNLQRYQKRSDVDRDDNDFGYYEPQEKRGGGRSFLPGYGALMYPNEKRIYEPYPYVFYDHMKRGGARLFRNYDNANNKYAYYYGL
uniref:FMRFamide-related neuropeptides-like n=1 Tax=Strongyloides stercoralis TaxID=6248 RepID=A0A0K0E3T8_STRER